LATGGGQQQRLLATSREQLRRMHPELDRHVISDEERRAEAGERRAGEEWRGGWGGVEVVVAARVEKRLGSVSVTRVRQARGFASRVQGRWSADRGILSEHHYGRHTGSVPGRTDGSNSPPHGTFGRDVDQSLPGLHAGCGTAE
jgi:hypothetical protein